MLDTNVAIHLRDRNEGILSRYGKLEGPACLSVVTRVQLEGGVWAKPEDAAIRRHRLDRLLKALPVIEFGQEAADACGRIIEVTGYSRRKVLDRMIAAQALVQGLTLVTTNAADFRDVPGLKLLEW